MNGWTTTPCRRMDPDLWFPDKEVDEGYAQAIRHCNTCPLITACLDAVLRVEAGVRANNRHGVYGGLTPHQRGALQMPLKHGTRSCYVNDLCRCGPCATAYRTPVPKTALAA